MASDRNKMPHTCPGCQRVFSSFRSMAGHVRGKRNGCTQEMRFWGRVKRGAKDECWLWQAAIRTDGYGHLVWNSKYLPAHRIAWALANGPIPKGEWVLHKCDVRACCNPNHLWLGSRQDNMDDMTSKGRRARGVAIKRVVLNESKVREIRRLRKLGLSYAKIGKAIGCSWSAAYCVGIGKFWRHVQ